MKSLIISLLQFVLITLLIHVSKDFQDSGSFKIAGIGFFTAGFLVSFQIMDLFSELKNIFQRA